MSSAVLTFALFMLSFLCIGLSAAKSQKKTVDDYLIGGREIKPWLNALSAASTNCSGFMFIGLIGVSYTKGMFTYWFVIGIMLGSLLVWYKWIPKLRARAGELKANTYLDVILPRIEKSSSQIALDRWFAGIITLLFLSIYAAAQLKAGTKAMQSIFDWPPELGIWMSAGLILVYCLSGGFRATVWSDAAQSAVMLLAMGILAFTSLYHLGGLEGLLSNLWNQDPMLATLFPSTKGVLGSMGAGLAWAMIGIGSLGQPHIMIRPIALPSTEDVPATRRIFFTYYLTFMILSVLVGVCTRALLPPSLGSFDHELALPRLAAEQLPSAMIGIVLAGVFASSISTADSQVLSCSAILGGDLRNSPQQSVTKQRLATLIVLIIIALIAIGAPANVFTLVILAWSALAAPFVPMVILSCWGIQMSMRHRLGVMVSALGTFFLCRQFGAPFGVNDLICAWLVAALVHKIMLSREQRAEER